ncbi:MAG: hypothetical protein AMJ75_01345 [Phycisphaerae bacterium SM1_79]|nr:MAG: hypothetical protein AMJ75_01345 [Phycisphaerae bacterium SM1_79]
MAKNQKKLKWEQLDGCFDLRLLNPETIGTNVHKAIKERLKIVKDTKSWGRHFSKEASTEFDRWLKRLNTPLKAQAYARLSNWFLCDMPFIRKTDLAVASQNLWNALFCSKPEQRLTSPKRDHKILHEKFVLWWTKQQKCQDDC